MNKLNFTKNNIDKFSKIESLINYIENYYNSTIYNGNGLEFKNATALPSNLLFLPNTKIPSFEKFIEIKRILKKHHQNVDLLKSLFNTTRINPKITIRRFEVFKTFDLPLEDFNKTNSFRDLLDLYMTKKKKTIVDFRNLENVSAQTRDADLLTQDFTNTLDKNSSIIKYFLGSPENYTNLSLNNIENIIEQNISSYVSMLLMDRYKVPANTGHIMDIELNFLYLAAYPNNKVKTTSKWTYNSSLLSPYNRYFYFKDFAIIYDFLITDHKQHIKSKTTRKLKKDHKLGISFYEYLQNESKYLEELKVNLKYGYIRYDNNKGYLTFNKSTGRYSGAIKKGYPLHSVIEQYNSRNSRISRTTSLMIFSGDNLLKGQRELKSEMESLAKVRSYVPPSTIKSLLGYTIDERYFMTFWNFNSFHNKDQQIWIKLSEYNKKRGGHWRNDFQDVQGGVARIHELFSGAQQSTQQLNSNNLIFISELPSKRPNEGSQTYKRRLSEVYDVKILDAYLGPEMNSGLNSSGEKINFFITNTKNLPEFYNSLKGNRFSNIKVEYSLTLSDKLKFYNDGMNLFIKTFFSEKFKSNSFGLKVIKSKKRKNESLLKLVEID